MTSAVMFLIISGVILPNPKSFESDRTLLSSYDTPIVSSFSLIIVWFTSALADTDEMETIKKY